MAKEVWFRDSGGRDLSCNEGSVAFDLMTKDGSFVRIDGPGAEAPAPAAEPEGEDLSKLTKKKLYELAVERDVPVTAKMSKAEIIAAIEAASGE